MRIARRINGLGQRVPEAKRSGVTSDCKAGAVTHPGSVNDQEFGHDARLMRLRAIHTQEDRSLRGYSGTLAQVTLFLHDARRCWWRPTGATGETGFESDGG
jgi:hypothetical protein